MKADEERLAYEIKVSLRADIAQALQMVADFESTSQSAFARQCIVKELCNRGIIQHPSIAKYQHLAAQQAQAQKAKPAA
jgi:hypothetical protein